MAALERQLAKGDKALVGNTGFRRYLKTISDQHFAIDPDKIEEEGPPRRCTHSVSSNGASRVDRRKVYVSLTDKGRRLCDILVAEAKKFNKRLVRGLSSSEQMRCATYFGACGTISERRTATLARPALFTCPWRIRKLRCCRHLE